MTGAAILMTLVFTIIKINGVGDIASWPWEWILSPLWILIAWFCLWTFIEVLF